MEESVAGRGNWVCKSRRWECVGVGNSESYAVAEAGHVECGSMQGRRPGKQLWVLWNKSNHLPGSQHGSVCAGSLPLGSAVPTDSHETLGKSLLCT